MKDIEKLEIGETIPPKIKGKSRHMELLVSYNKIDNDYIEITTYRNIKKNPLKFNITNYTMKIATPYLKLNSSKTKEFEF